jgi:hypothetical protein
VPGRTEKFSSTMLTTKAMMMIPQSIVTTAVSFPANVVG